MIDDVGDCLVVIMIIYFLIYGVYEIEVVDFCDMIYVVGG